MSGISLMMSGKLMSGKLGEVVSNTFMNERGLVPIYR